MRKLYFLLILSLSACIPKKEEIAPLQETTIINNKTEECNDCFITLEISPIFPGGYQSLQKFMADNIKHSNQLGEAKGRVYVSFMISETGAISAVRVIKGINDYYDSEAIRIVKSMPNWIPGRVAGKLIKVKYTMPVNFSQQ